jgi:hypothetical protein
LKAAVNKRACCEYSIPVIGQQQLRQLFVFLSLAGNYPTYTRKTTTYVDLQGQPFIQE